MKVRAAGLSAESESGLDLGATVWARQVMSSCCLCAVVREMGNGYTHVRGSFGSMRRPSEDMHVKSSAQSLVFRAQRLLVVITLSTIITAQTLDSLPKEPRRTTMSAHRWVLCGANSWGDSRFMIWTLLSRRAIYSLSPTYQVPNASPTRAKVLLGEELSAR